MFSYWVGFWNKIRKDVGFEECSPLGDKIGGFFALVCCLTPNQPIGPSGIVYSDWQLLSVVFLKLNASSCIWPEVELAFSECKVLTLPLNDGTSQSGKVTIGILYTPQSFAYICPEVSGAYFLVSMHRLATLCAYVERD